MFHFLASVCFTSVRLSRLISLDVKLIEVKANTIVMLHAINPPLLWLFMQFQHVYVTYRRRNLAERVHGEELTEGRLTEEEMDPE